MKRLLIPLAASLLAGCATYAVESAGDKTGQIGRSVKVGDYNLTPLRILEDSRCPNGVTCVWPGRVRLLVRQKHDGTVEMREMSLPDIGPGHGVPVLVSVSPERRSNATIPASDYRFSFQPGPLD